MIPIYFIKFSLKQKKGMDFVHTLISKNLNKPLGRFNFKKGKFYQDKIFFWQAEKYVIPKDMTYDATHQNKILDNTISY